MHIDARRDRIAVSMSILPTAPQEPTGGSIEAVGHLPIWQIVSGKTPFNL